MSKPSEWRSQGGVLLILCLFGLFVYANSLRNPFIWDDSYLITQNHFVRSFGNLPEVFKHHLYYSTAGLSNFYRPLQTTFLMLDYALWGFEPFGYHLTSLIFHILCAFAAFGVVALLFQRRWVAFLVALLFLVHPINSTVVDYVSSRADSQATLFMLCSLGFFFQSGTAVKRRLLWYGGSLLCFAFALLSKEMAVSLPLLIFSAALFLDRKRVGKVIPFSILLGIYVCLRLTILNFSEPNLENFPSLEVRLLTTVESFVRLAGSLFVPLEVHMEKNLPLSTGFLQSSTLLSLLIWAAVGVGMAWVRRRSRICFFGLLWFFITLLPMANIVPINATIADHWLYLPCIGFFMALIGGLADWIQTLKPTLQPRWVWASIGFYAASVFIYSGLTVRQNTVWNDPIRFFELVLRYSPDSSRAHNELGAIYLDRQQVDTAISHFQLAIQIDPQFDQPYHNLAVAYSQKGGFQQAIVLCQRALRLSPNNPRTYNNLGNLYCQLKQFDGAIEAYQTALRLNPDYEVVYNNLGTVYFQMGQFEKAETMWKQALQIDPQFQMVLDNLCLLKQRREHQAGS